MLTTEQRVRAHDRSQALLKSQGEAGTGGNQAHRGQAALERECSMGCEFQFNLGPAGAGSHIHVHDAAANGLLRGKKRWWIYPPHYNLAELSGVRPNGVQITAPAFKWAAGGQLQKLRDAGIHACEFVQHAGEVVCVAPARRQRAGSGLHCAPSSSLM